VVVGWSVRAVDGWSGAHPERVAARVVPRLEDGAIVLLHDAAERDDFRPASLDALPRILSAMRARDLPGVRIDAWIAPPASSVTSPPRARGAQPS
jgi:peptidoglycan/xylan/chitin deacetylase (PgdA/CDA1 family)